MTGFAEDNAPYAAPMTKAEFCRFAERAEGKYEWKGGRVVQMTNVSRAHARIVTNFIRVFSSLLDIDRWSVFANDFGVETDDAIRYPDIVVEPFEDDEKGKRSCRPAILVEVLSPSTSGTDFIEKLQEYCTFGTLQAYIVASQDEAIVWVWQRDAASGAFPAKPQEIAGRKAAVELTALGLSLPMAELYRGIKTVQ